MSVNTHHVSMAVQFAWPFLSLGSLRKPFSLAAAVLLSVSGADGAQLEGSILDAQGCEPSSLLELPVGGPFQPSPEGPSFVDPTNFSQGSLLRVSLRQKQPEWSGLGG